MERSKITVSISFQNTRSSWSADAPQANVGKLLEETPFCQFAPYCFEVSRNGTILNSWDHFNQGDAIVVTRIR